jgi:hypothetical protein
LFSCPICAKFVVVVVGSEVNVNPSCGEGVKGGFVAGVVVVTEMGADTISMKFPLKVEPLLKDRFVLMPFQ